MYLNKGRTRTPACIAGGGHSRSPGPSDPSSREFPPPRPAGLSVLIVSGQGGGKARSGFVRVSAEAPGRARTAPGDAVRCGAGLRGCGHTADGGCSL